MSGGIPEADREGDLAHPREVYDLFGHESQARTVDSAFAGGRMHHAWMIVGPKGVGKATLAYRLARRALGAVPMDGAALASSPDDPVCRQIEGLAHPDFLLIRRPYNDKTKKLKAEITVDEARKAADFFSRSAGGGAWRIVIVDSADEMNVNASNALLKTLEEPPKRGLLILIVETPGRLLPTIRSRCRKLVLRPPDIAQTQDWLERRHGIGTEQAEQAASLAHGAPGAALANAVTGASELKSDIDRLLANLPGMDRGSAMRLAEASSRKGAEQRRATLMKFLAQFAQDQARAAALSEAGSRAAAPWVKASDELRRLAREADTIYLDPKQTVLAALALIEDAAKPD